MRTKLLFVMVFFTMVSIKGFSQCLLWSDEFDGTSLDENKWTYDLGDGCGAPYYNCGWGNNELEYYTKENATVSNGQLAITPKYNPNYNGTGKNYTSSRLLTKGKFSQKYGRFEARIKVPTAGGVWPAFWMLGDNFPTTNWPLCGEIDIMETNNNATTLWNTIHYANVDIRLPKGNKGGIPDTTIGHLSKGVNYPAVLSNDFHTYRIDWTDQYVKWYLDDVLKFTVTRDQFSATYTGANWAFDQNFFMLLNVAVGGNFAGSDTPTDYPVSMLVDYVRVYSLNPCPTANVNITSPTNNSSFILGSNINITADALFPNGTVSKVEFFDNGSKIGEDLTSPFNYTWTGATLGSHSLTAVATEALGETVTSNVVTVNVNNLPAQSPYLGTPYNLSGTAAVTIEAENFDIGGQNIAYFDKSSGNSGNSSFRSNVDVDIQTISGGGNEIINIEQDEWLEYTVNVTAGTYKIDVRALGAGAKLHMEMDGVTIKSFQLGNGPNYQTVSASGVTLTNGQKVLRIYFDSPVTKLNYVVFTRTGAKMASVLSFDNTTSLKALEVYPNPTENSSLVKLNVVDATNAEYTIVNSMGIELSRGKLSSNREGTVNLTGMEKGIYYVKVVANEKVYVEKLVKE